MIELHENSLKFTFPEVHPQAELLIDFQRTLRIPDDDHAYPLLPGPGIIGAGLIVEEELIHLSIFPATEEGKRNSSNIQTPQHRRRNMNSEDIIF